MEPKKEIITDDILFRAHVIESLATIVANQHHQSEGIKKMDTCLYGEDGTNGLVSKVSDLHHQQKWWNRGLTVAQAAVLGLAAYFGITK